MCDLLHNHLPSYNVHAHFFASFKTEQQLAGQTHSTGNDRMNKGVNRQQEYRK